MINNLSKKTTIAETYKILTSPWSQGIGLMFKNKVETPLVFYFHKDRKASIHNFFVFCPIDAIFVGNDNTVVDIKENFRPWRLYWSKEKCAYFIEVSAGTIRKTKTAVGDEISLKN